MHRLSPKAVLTATLLAIFASAPASAEPKDDIEFVVNQMITKANYVALLTSDRDGVRRQLVAKIDFANISENDQNAILDLFIDESAEAMVAGLRTLFKEKLLNEMPASDTPVMRSCIETGNCNPDDYSPEGQAVLEDLSRFGQAQGQIIGRQVGASIQPQLISAVRENAGNKFDDPELLLQALTVGLGN